MPYRLSKAVQYALQPRKVKERIAALGGNPFQGGMDDWAKFVAAELQRMGKRIREPVVTIE